jgi:hypothetical protein
MIDLGVYDAMKEPRMGEEEQKRASARFKERVKKMLEELDSKEKSNV